MRIKLGDQQITNLRNPRTILKVDKPISSNKKLLQELVSNEEIVVLGGHSADKLLNHDMLGDDLAFSIDDLLSALYDERPVLFPFKIASYNSLSYQLRTKPEVRRPIDGSAVSLRLSKRNWMDKTSVWPDQAFKEYFTLLSPEKLFTPSYDAYPQGWTWNLNGVKQFTSPHRVMMGAEKAVYRYYLELKLLPLLLSKEHNSDPKARRFRDYLVHIVEKKSLEELLDALPVSDGELLKIKKANKSIYYLKSFNQEHTIKILNPPLHLFYLNQQPSSAWEIIGECDKEDSFYRAHRITRSGYYTNMPVHCKHIISAFWTLYIYQNSSFRREFSGLDDDFRMGISTYPLPTPLMTRLYDRLLYDCVELNVNEDEIKIKPLNLSTIDVILMALTSKLGYENCFTCDPSTLQRIKEEQNFYSNNSHLITFV